MNDLKISGSCSNQIEGPAIQAGTMSATATVTAQRVSHGQARRCVSAGPYSLTEAYYSADQIVARHEHAFPSWTLLLNGSFQENFSREELICFPGSVLIKSATADHSNRYGTTGAHCFLIEAHDEDTLTGVRGAAMFAVTRTCERGLIPSLAKSIYREFGSADPVSGFALSALLIELSGATARPTAPSAKKHWLNDVRDQLEAEFRSPPSLSELAHGRDVHPVYLCQAFRREFGITVGEFVRQVRFEWARDALRVHAGSICDIALEAGFSDQAHFTREFTKRAGQSPARFRQSKV